MGIMERIREIEAEINRTQKNKATNYHIGLLKAKLSKLRSELLEPSGKGKGGGEGFDVMKSGDARVALIGFPSVGKSTLLSTLTNTHSEAAAYEFTTLTCIAAGTLVALADGTSVPIEKMRTGLDVLSYHAALGEGEMEGLTGREVTAVLDRGERECVELLFIDGRTLVCTPDHRIRTADGRWREADQLKVGRDEVAVSVDYPTHAAREDAVRYSVHSNARVLPLSLVQLVERRSVGLKRVYDLSVPSTQGDDTCSFTANGIVVHNCLAEDTEVLTDRGFMTRAEVFAACPELAPSSPTAAPASDNVILPFGGAVYTRTVNPLYWTPSEKADEAAGIRLEQLTGAKSTSAVQLRDSAGRHGRQCGLCRRRGWSVSSRGAGTQMYQHNTSAHHAEVAAASRTGGPASVTSAAPASSISRLSSSTATATPTASASPLLFASLDPSTGHLVYLPATAITYKLVSSLVEFTHAAEAPSWQEDADEYGLTPGEQRRMKECSDRARAGEVLEEEDKYRPEHLSNGASLLVDRQHDMYVRVGLADTRAGDKHSTWADDYVKVKAGSLVSDSSRQRVRMTGQATAGFDASAISDDQLPFIAALRLSNTAEIDTFLWLYGYWCGDGWLASRDRAVAFGPKKDEDKKELKKQLEALGFTVPSESVHVYDNANGGCTFEVTDRRWVDYFFGEYGPKYGAPSVSSSRPHTHTGLTTPLPRSVKWSAQQPLQHTRCPVLLIITRSLYRDLRCVLQVLGLGVASTEGSCSSRVGWPPLRRRKGGRRPERHLHRRRPLP